MNIWGGHDEDGMPNFMSRPDYSDNSDYDESEEWDDDNDYAEDSEVEMLQHSYVLRQGLTINILLPANLTSKETDRLSQFICSLPFEE